MSPVQGFMHAAYVFRAIQDFCRALLGAGRCDAPERRYLERRLATVEAEMLGVSDARGSEDFTDHGRRFFSGLIS